MYTKSNLAVLLSANLGEKNRLLIRTCIFISLSKPCPRVSTKLKFLQTCKSIIQTSFVFWGMFLIKIIGQSLMFIDVAIFTGHPRKTCLEPLATLENNKNKFELFGDIKELFPIGTSWAALGPSLRRLGASWSLLGASWDRCGTSWKRPASDSNQKFDFFY